MRGANDVSTWSAAQAERYAQVGHGADGALFLDPHLRKALSAEVLRGKDVIDLGTGAGRFAGYALSNGAGNVIGVDINEAMVEQARRDLAGESGELPSNLRLEVGDVGSLTEVDSASQDVLMSILVGCNLPAETFDAHFEEAMRIARPGATFIVAAPNSLAVPFTSKGSNRDMQNDVDGLWEEENECDVIAAKRAISGLGNRVLRATFVLDPSDNRPVLVTYADFHGVEPGDPIIRKIPGLAVDNNWHVAQEYTDAAKAAGWGITNVEENCFNDADARANYNFKKPDDERLGHSYVGNPPFLLMTLKKAA
jgi:SAM-dependent methyltransferase